MINREKPSKLYFRRTLSIFAGTVCIIGAAIPAHAGPCGLWEGTSHETSTGTTTACGLNATSTGSLTAAYGASANASNSGAVAVGYAAIASNINAIALGTSATASAVNSIALGGGGSSTIASGSNATAVGADGRAQGANSTAMGASARATLFQSTAYGYNSQATGADSFAAGAGARATNQGSLAFGGNSLASGQGSSAIGGGAIATGTNATAIGRAAAAQYDGSTAIGENAISTQARQIRLGGQYSIVSIGDISASTAAQLGPLDGRIYYATIDSSGTIGQGAKISGVDALTAMQYNAAIDDLQSGQALIDDAVATHGRQIGDLFDLAAQNRRESRRGTAAAMALSTAPFPPKAGQTGYAANTSVFRGEVAFSASLSHRFSAAPFALNASISRAGGKSTGVNIGLSGAF